MARSTRERLIDAGLLLFSRDGLDATAVIDLEAEAGLRPGSGSFYRHFPSKDQLFVAVITREVDRVRGEPDERASPRAAIDPRVALALEFRRVLDSLSRRRTLIDLVARNRVAVRELLDRPDRAEAIVHDGFQVRTEVLAGLMDAGRIPRRDLPALATTLASAIIGYHATSVFMGAPPGETGADDFISVLVDLVAT